ncbi:MAG: phospholipid/cholesterol/gamma-HCH transport system substrate-binding protein [Thermoleophilaceae bacterium]|jgi:virulence factor Mce-like protein|nr:phospholipid/cholesterol/gamma-HCH transport system substrate-binding protein [Thermoleophilaceae bacterium]
MRGKSGTAAIVASPVLVGAVTTLIVIVSVFLAYNANKGLPFVPTYDISAALPSGSNLVEGNEVRVGGFRVGVVDRIGTTTKIVNGQPKAVATIHMKLDKTVEPLPVDTGVLIRQRSALGLKYVQLTPGVDKRVFRPGDTIPLDQSSLPVEFDDLLNTFDQPTRMNSRFALSGFGDALAGRGSSINAAIEGLNPFFQFLTPVMRNLSDPRTRLNQFFKQIGATSAQVAPVARVQAVLFSNMADTFAALVRCPDCLRATIEKSPPTEDASIRSFRVNQPFLADFTDLSRRFTPSVRVLPAALTRLSGALAVGTPVVRDTVTLNEQTTNVFNALRYLVRDPSTLLALRDGRDAVSVLNPFVNYVAPYQTVCNGAVYFFTGLQGDVGFETANGSAQAALLKLDGSSQQDNKLGDIQDRPADFPSNMDPRGAVVPPDQSPVEVQHTQAYGPAIDAQGNADCQIGQSGYPVGPLNGRVQRGNFDPSYKPASVADPTSSSQIQSFNNNQAGGSHTVNQMNTPGLMGPTFTGVPNLRDVP